jgi:RNA polymerase sigma factor (sigma-70 family)
VATVTPRGQARGQAREASTFDALLLAVRDGAPWAWRHLYEWLAPAVAGYLRAQGAHEPEDLTSETFLGVVRGIQRFTGDEQQLRSWVFVIAHRRLQDERRRRAVRPDPVPIDDAPRSAGGDAEAEALQRLATDRVRAVCARLAPDQRDVLLLRLVADLTVDQIALVLGKTSGAVKALQRRGFESVRRILEREGVPL